MTLTQQKITRRALLMLAGRSALGMTVGSSLSACAARLKAISEIKEDYKPQTLSPVEWAVLTSVQEHFLPSSSEAPGARECRATLYLDLALTGSDIDPIDLKIIRKGVPNLEKLALEKFKRSFVSLSEPDRETVLRVFEDDEDGSEWLSVVMSYTLEAYLGDPAYGGNPKEIVWRWLGHTPGFPQPVLINAANRR